MTLHTENTTLKNEPVPFMNTLTERINKATKDGYTDTLKITKQGLYSESKHRAYAPDQVKVVDFFRFEGQSDPADNAIMYVIETSDGLKGILIDAYGAYADEHINKFMTDVEEINKKEKK